MVTSMNFKLCATLLVAGVLSEWGFMPALAGAQNWYDAGWERRISFIAEADSIEGDGDLVDFKMVLQLDATQFGSVFTHGDPDGGDLVITSGDGQTALPYELVDFDPILQRGELWFKADVLSKTNNQFYLYFDNPDESGTPSVDLTGPQGAVWGDDHLAVYHFTEDPSLGTLRDWGPARNDAVAAVAPTPTGPGWLSSNRVEGVVGAGWEFDGQELWCYAPGISTSESSYTISAWFANFPDVDSGALAFQAENTLFRLSFQVTGGSPLSDFHTPSGQITWLPSTTNYELHHYAWTLDATADTVRFYFDGEERPVWSRYTPPGQSGPIYQGLGIGTRVGIAGPYDFNPLDLSDGVVDEYRIVEGVRGPEWIRTEYRNQKNPVAFFTALSEESYWGGTTGVGSFPSSSDNPFGTARVWPNPFQGLTWIDVETDVRDVAVSIYDGRGRLVRTLPRPETVGGNTLRFLWDGRDDTGAPVSNMIYYVRSQHGQSVISSKVIVIR